MCFSFELFIYKKHSYSVRSLQNKEGTLLRQKTVYKSLPPIGMIPGRSGISAINFNHHFAATSGYNNFYFRLD